MRKDGTKRQAMNSEEKAKKGSSALIGYWVIVSIYSAMISMEDVAHIRIVFKCLCVPILIFWLSQVHGTKAPTIMYAALFCAFVGDLFLDLELFVP